jgi:hypothetical protein
MKINHVDENEIHFPNLQETYLISYAWTKIKILFEWGSDTTQPYSNLFLLNIKKSKAHM